MRRVLFIAGGVVAKEVLESITSIFLAKSNDYIVIYNDDTILPSTMPENFTFHKFDPTSFSKMSNIFSTEVSEVFLILDNKEEIKAVYDNIRMLKKSIKISILDSFDMELKDKNLSIIDANKIQAGRVIDKLPNVPVTAQNLGLGIGEIMEVAIPFGSSFVYRSVGSIQQKNWKIVAIYRANSLLIAKESFVIQPNDSLLIIGDPLVLKNIYQAIKKELGQFPAPFGNNIYLYMDMKNLDAGNIYRHLDEAVTLNKKLKNKRLIIRIANPTNTKILDHVKQFERKDISVNIDYYQRTLKEIVDNDVKKFGVGLLIVSQKLFSRSANRKTLFDLGLPILKIGKKSLNEIQNSIVLLSNKKEIEKISPVVFDISSQLNLNIKLYDFNPDNDDRSLIVEHFENLSKIFTKKIEIISSEIENPIRWIKKNDEYLQIMPFSQEITISERWWFMSTDIERLYFKLKDEHQLFVPVVV